MLKFVLIFCFLNIFSLKSNGEEKNSVFEKTFCDPEKYSWTSWFNSENPSENSGNDFETIDQIRKISSEMNRCKTIVNVDSSIFNRSTESENSYQLIVNQTGLYCTASSPFRCPDFQVRFCCLREQQKISTNCGQTFRQPNLNPFVRIVNGLEAIPHSFPWAVSLQYNGFHDCGGVIIDQWHILTAAHCLDYEDSLGNYFVRVAAHDRTNSGQLIPVSKLINHPNYNEKRSTDDIGIVRLATPILFSEQVQPICLPETIVEPRFGTTAFVVGWGNTIYQSPSSSSNVLLQARLRVIADCSMYYAFDFQKQICAASNGPIDRDHGSCQGDSGGALYYEQNGRWFAAGVVSYAIGCGRLAFPTVFTKTSGYIDWIRSVTSQTFSG